MHEVLGQLESLRKRSRLLLLVQRCAAVAAGIVAAIVLLGLADYVLRLPSAVRLILLLAALAILVLALMRYIFTAISYRPSLTQLALRLERTLPAMAGRLASSVEFSLSGEDRANPLAARSVRDAQARLSGESMGRLLKPAPTLRNSGLFLIALAVAVSLILVSPVGARTALSRLLMPLGSAQWPARTSVQSMMSEALTYDSLHPRGVAMPLRARNLTHGDEAGRVDAHFRLQSDGRFESWQHIVLTHQSGGVHERLIDADADIVEIYFSTEDNRTDVESVRIVPPPAVVTATLTVTPPDYAAARIGEFNEDLGPGLDQRAIAENPALVGSRVELELQMNKSLPVPVDAAAREAWIAETFNWDDDDDLEFTDLSSTPEGPARWSIAWQVTRTVSLGLNLVDAHGLPSSDPVRYTIPAVDDLPPAVVITDPQNDDAVLPTAVVSLTAEAKDDLAVTRVGITARHQPAGSDEATALNFGAERTADSPDVIIESEIDLGDFDLAEGDVVIVQADADDDFNLSGSRHATSVSPTRTLRIITEIDLAQTLRRHLAAVRQNAIRIETQQYELQDDVIDRGPVTGVDRAQAQIGDRIARQRDEIDEVRRQLSRNRLEDDQLSALIQQASDLLDYAGRASGEAVSAIEQRPPGAAEPGAQRPADEADDELRVAAPEDQPIVEAQQNVRDELADLIELLDRDEDTWMVQRQLQSIIKQQEDLEQATNQLAPQTIGRDRSELPASQVNELDRIEQEQSDLRDQARRLIDELRRRAEALEELDPQSAAGMRAAADTAERRQVDREMETAAENARENRLQSAAAAQQAARQALQQMLDDIQETRKARAEELLRRLASLIESIKRLIEVQENEIIALAAAEHDGSFGGRDRAMIRLAQNTHALAADTRAAGQEARRVARALDRAADAQGAAVASLRADPVDAPAADEAENRSLSLLNEALTLAEELEQRTQEEQVTQRRQELINRYRELAEKQVMVRDETVALDGEAELTRRQLVDARRLGNEQNEIRLALATIEQDTGTAIESEIFTYVHRLIDRWSTVVSDALWAGEVGIDVTDRQQMIAESIFRQISALEELDSQPPEFVDEQQDGGGGDGTGKPPLIPPEAELMRLHGLQEQVYLQTRDVDARVDLTEVQRRNRLREMGELQRVLIDLGRKMMEDLNLDSGDTPPEDANGYSPGNQANAQIEPTTPLPGKLRGSFDISIQLSNGLITPLPGLRGAA